MTLPANPQGARDARCTVPALLLLLLQLTLPVSALSGEWRVTPIRIDLGKEAKSGAVTVFNESEERLQVQMNAMEWTQDAEAKDQYTETGDILFFPRIMIFDRQGERILRAGIKLPPGGKEKSYRLFIEEIPEPRQTEGARVAIAIRFGVPIFVKPVKEDLRGEVGNLSMTEGVVGAVARNSGNVHLLVRAVLVQGKDGSGKTVFTKELGGWYLLAGAKRAYTAEVPADVCREIARVDVEVRAETLSFTGTLVADPSMCATK